MHGWSFAQQQATNLCYGFGGIARSQKKKKKQSSRTTKKSKCVLKPAISNQDLLICFESLLCCWTLCFSVRPLTSCHDTVSSLLHVFMWSLLFHFSGVVFNPMYSTMLDFLYPSLLSAQFCNFSYLVKYFLCYIQFSSVSCNP